MKPILLTLMPTGIEMTAMLITIIAIPTLLLYIGYKIGKRKTMRKG